MIVASSEDVDLVGHVVDLELEVVLLLEHAAILSVFAQTIVHGLSQSEAKKFGAFPGMLKHAATADVLMAPFALDAFTRKKDML